MLVLLHFIVPGITELYSCTLLPRIEKAWPLHLHRSYRDSSEPLQL